MNDEYRNELVDYRADLNRMAESSQRDFDKQIVFLAGGAFGVTFTFVKDIVGPDPVSTHYLALAWVSWALAIVCSLFSLHFSVLSMRRAAATVARAIETGDTDALYSGKPGGVSQSILEGLNLGSGLLFLAGVLFVALFVTINY